MKSTKQSICLVSVGLFLAASGVAQSIPSPTIWFGFDGTANNFTTAYYGAVSIQTDNNHLATQHYTNRFGHSDSVISFWSNNDKQTHVSVVNAGTTNTTGIKLLGYSNNTDPVSFPDNFTISCWVYADPSSTLVRKIVYADNDNSGFALLHKGSDIFLRRVVSNGNRFDYFFGAPASFDAGTGWYHVILVMGKRSPDNARYTKLYVGKPSLVKYDATGPRVVTATSPADPLASNFGGAYTFTGVQSFMTTTTSWGLGNADNSDPVHSTNIAPVYRVDDLAVWGIALTDMEAFQLFDCQRQHPADQCWAAPQSRMAQPEQPQDTVAVKDTLVVAVKDTVSTETIRGITVFPNPTSGETWLRISGIKAGTDLTCTLMDMNGRVLHTRRIAGVKDGQAIRLGNLKAITKVPGTYLLRVVTPDGSKTIKLVVQ